MQDELTSLSSAELTDVTGGGWKSKAVKWGWETAKWTGIPAVIGGGAAWVKRQVMGPNPPPEAPAQDP